MALADNTVPLVRGYRRAAIVYIGSERVFYSIGLSLDDESIPNTFEILQSFFKHTNLYLVHSTVDFILTKHWISQKASNLLY